MPKDTIIVDHESLRAAKQKYRTLVKQIEEGGRPANDLLHPAYKLGEFLTEGLGVAWTDADTRVPDTPVILLCECDSLTCRGTLPLTSAEYLSARDIHFRAAVVLPGHQSLDDIVIQTHDNFLVVRRDEDN